MVDGPVTSRASSRIDRRRPYDRAATGSPSRPRVLRRKLLLRRLWEGMVLNVGLQMRQLATAI